MSGGQRVRISEWALEAEAGLWQEELGKTEVYLSQKGDGKEGTQQGKIPNTPGEDVSDPSLYLARTSLYLTQE